MQTIIFFNALLLISQISATNVLTSCGVDRKAIALTFDDGPAIENQISLKLLTKLQKLGIVATFYSSPAAMGDDDEQMQGRCEMIRTLADAGMQIGLHNWEHEKLGSDVKRGQFPPYGILTKSQADYINTRGYTIAMWNVEPNDSEEKLSAEQIFNAGWKDFEENVGVGNSAVWSLHDSMFTSDSVDQFLDMIVQKYRDELGYEFITMDECYKDCRQDQCSGGKLGGPKPDEDIFAARPGVPQQKLHATKNREFFGKARLDRARNRQKDGSVRISMLLHQTMIVPDLVLLRLLDHIVEAE